MQPRSAKLPLSHNNEQTRTKAYILHGRRGARSNKGKLAVRLINRLGATSILSAEIIRDFISQLSLVVYFNYLNKTLTYVV